MTATLLLVLNRELHVRRGKALVHCGGTPRPGYFSLTNRRTKIAHTPTVMGNCARAMSRRVPPRGNTYVNNIMAIAVSTPRRSLLFQFIGRPRLHDLDCKNAAIVQRFASWQDLYSGIDFVEEGQQ